MHAKRAATFLLFLLFMMPPALCPADQGVLEVRRLLLFFEVDPAAGITRREVIFLYESLLADLADADEKMTVIEPASGGIPPSDAEKNTAAEEAGADSWLQVRVSGSFQVPHLEARLLDLLTGQIVVETTVDKELIRGLRDLERGYWADIVRPSAEYLARAPTRNLESGLLTLSAVPGTTVHGIGGQHLKIGSEGTASTEVPLPSTLPFRATKLGYWPVEGQIYMNAPEKLVSIEQERGTRLAIDFYLGDFNSPGLAVLYYLLPDTLFARAGVLSYLIGFNLEDDDRSESSFFTSQSLNLINAAFGMYLNAPDRLVRPYLAAGAFLRFITARGYWGLEPIAPFALQSILGFEYSRNPKLRLFFEYSPCLYWTKESGRSFLLLLSFPEHAGPRGYLALSDAWVLSLRDVRLGVRWKL